MTRHFGIPQSSDRRQIAGDNSAGGPLSANATRADNVIWLSSFLPAGSPANSGGESRQPSIQAGEIAGGLLFFGLLLGSWLIVAAIAFGYRALVS